MSSAYPKTANGVSMQPSGTVYSLSSAICRSRLWAPTIPETS
jgi:hypothetical protein